MWTFFFQWICTAFGQLRWRAGEPSAGCWKHSQPFLSSGAPPLAGFSWLWMGAGCPLASCMCENKNCCGAQQILAGPAVVPREKQDSSDLFCRSWWELRARRAMRWQCWGWIGESAMPRPALPSSEPAAGPGLRPAPAGINRSGFHWLPRDLDPVCRPHRGWQLSTSPPLVLLCARPGSLRGDGNHCIPRGLGCFSLTAPGNPRCCCQLCFYGLRRLGVSIRILSGSWTGNVISLKCVIPAFFSVGVCLLQM